MTEQTLLAVIWSLWPKYDTAQIAAILRIPEAEVYNRLDKARALKVRAV